MDAKGILLCAALALPASAAAAPKAEIHSRALCPGELLLVAVRGQKPGQPPSGRFDASRLAFHQASPGTYLAFVGLDLDISTGNHRLELDLRGTDGKAHFWGSDVLVSSKTFPQVELKVEQNFVTPKKEDERRADEEGKTLAAIFARVSPQRYFEGDFASPIHGARSARFGERRVFNGVPKSPHSGADLRAKTGTPVLAPAGGKVVLAGNLFYAGNTVVLDHGWGLFSYYGHLSKISVKAGKVVRRGDLLGKVGATGRVTGPHLHWSTRLGEARIDPFSVAGLDLDRWVKPAKKRKD